MTNDIFFILAFEEEIESFKFEYFENSAKEESQTAEVMGFLKSEHSTALEIIESLVNATSLAHFEDGVLYLQRIYQKPKDSVLEIELKKKLITKETVEWKTNILNFLKSLLTNA